MSRKTPNFIRTFVERYDNGFIPTKFYIWGAISTVAAALERKVWLPWHNGNVYPNMYIFLVSGPGVGKSSAINPGESLLRKMAEKHNRIIRFLPEHLTEAKLFDMLNEHDYFTYKNQHYPHTSAYFIASEGSVSFKHSEEHGIVKALTRLYDKKDFEKATVSRKDVVKVNNPCINILTGTTFHDLNNFLTKAGILGGFASRVTFVAHSTVKKRKSEWFDEDNQAETKRIVDTDLIHDLAQINSMVGGFKATKEVKEAWNVWWEEFDDQFIATTNEVKKAFMARKQVGLHKLVQILSAAESNDKKITLAHWEWALRLIDEVEKDLPSMLLKGQSSDTNKSSGLKASIIMCLLERPGYYNRQALLAELTLRGHNPMVAMSVLQALVNDPTFIKNDGGRLSFVGDPDFHG